MNCVCVRSVIVKKPVLKNNYSKKFQKITEYFITLRKPAKMTFKEFNVFKKKAFRFKIQNNQLFRRNNKNVSMRRIIDNFEKRLRIFETLHDENDHRNRKKIYQRVADRY